MSITAKVKCTSKALLSMGTQYEQIALKFSADYAEGRNKEWAMATPVLSIDMTVKPEVGERFEIGQAFTLTFTTEGVEVRTLSGDGADNDAP